MYVSNDSRRGRRDGGSGAQPGWDIEDSGAPDRGNREEADSIWEARDTVATLSVDGRRDHGPHPAS